MKSSKELKALSFTKLIGMCFVACLLIVQGCASTPTGSFDSTFESEREQNEAELEAESSADRNEESLYGNQIENLEPLSTDRQVISQSSSDELELNEEEDITVSFENLPLDEFITHSLANLLGIDFVIDPKAPINDGKVTLSLNEPVSQKRYLTIFKDLLEQNGLSIKVQNGIVFIFNRTRNSGYPAYDYGFGRTAQSVPMGSQPIFQVVPIDFIDPTSMASFLIRLSNASPEKLNDPNLLGVRGERNDILRALDIINIIDSPKVQGKSISFIRLNYIPAEQFISKVQELLTNDGINPDTSVRFTDLTRQNGIVVHSNNQQVIERVKYWQTQLDTPESTDERQYFMYYPENMEAKKLSNVLSQLVSVMSSGSGMERTQQSPMQSNTGQQMRSQSASNANLQSSGVGQDFSFVVDENRNVIIIYSTATKYKTVLPLLKKLDVSPPQVLIEAKLIEVSLEDNLSQGIEWSLYGGTAKRDRSTSQRTEFLRTEAGSLFSYTISGADYNLALTLNQNKNKVKILSSPRIVVQNGESASINVGTDIPVLSTQSADVDSERVLQSIQYRSTGVDLKVKPTVNSSNVISLELTQNVSEAGTNNSSGIDSPLILQRSFSTSVIANSGQSLVLGGLIRENNSDGQSQIPVLGDLPIIGNLFSNKSVSKGRTELVVLITPRIISNSSDIDELKTLFIDELTLFEDEN